MLDKTSNQLKNGLIHNLSTAQSDGDGEIDKFKSFELVDLGSDRAYTPTRMREEIVLLAWLIVILRTRDSSQISYEWTYKGQADDFEHRRLPMDDVVQGLQSNVQEVLAAISSYSQISVDDTLSPVSLLLSTGSLSPASVDTKEEVRMKIHLADQQTDLGSKGRDST